jgi:hypothetical protein
VRLGRIVLPPESALTILYQHSESLTRHARACRGHPRLRKPCKIEGVNGRDESGHDDVDGSQPMIVGVSTYPS